MEPTGVALVASLVEERSARLVAVTGGVAAGKTTFAAALADALPRTAAVVSTDGFLLSGHPRKGFPDSYDAAALRAFLGAVDARDPDAGAPVYSHRTYDVVPGERIIVGDAEVVIVEGLHLASAELGARDRFDFVVHLDAAEELLRGWYLARFQELRTAAESDPTAFLHPYVSMGPDALDAMALQVWDDVNLVVLHEHARRDAARADVELWLDADHAVIRTRGA